MIYKYGPEQSNFHRNDPSRPLVYLSFTLNYLFGELDPFGYRFVNLLLHIINMLLVFLIAGKIFQLFFKAEYIWLALVVALIFGVHPVNTVIIGIAFNRSSALGGFFLLSSLFIFWNATEKSKPIWYVISYLMFIGALFSRQDSIVLPAIVFLLDWLIISNNRKEILKKRLRWHIGFVIILSLYLLYRFLYFGQLGDLEARAGWENIDYLLIQPYVLIRYVWMLLIPSGFCIDHKILPIRNLFDQRLILPVLMLGFITVMIYKVYKKKGPQGRHAVFSLLWFTILLLPTTVIPTTTAMADNRLYLSGIGIFLAVVMLVYALSTKISLLQQKFYKGAASVAIILYFLLLISMNQKRISLYNHPLLLWKDVIKQYPYSSRPHNNIGLLYSKKGEIDKAIVYYLKALELNPNNVKAYQNLGNAYYALNKYEEAMHKYKKVINLSPNYSKGYYNLGNVYSVMKRSEEALHLFEKSIELDPLFAPAHNNLANLLIKTGKLAQAYKEYQKAIAINPGYYRAYYNLGNLYLKTGDSKSAENSFKKALLINPKYIKPRISLGRIYYYQKSYDKSLTQFSYIMQIDPYMELAEDMIKKIKNITEKGNR